MAERHLVRVSCSLDCPFAALWVSPVVVQMLHEPIAAPSLFLYALPLARLASVLDLPWVLLLL